MRKTSGGKVGKGKGGVKSFTHFLQGAIRRFLFLGLLILFCILLVVNKIKIEMT